MSKVEKTIALTSDFGEAKAVEGQETAGPNVRAQVVTVDGELANIIIATQGGNVVMSKEDFEVFVKDIGGAIGFIQENI